MKIEDKKYLTSKNGSCFLLPKSELLVVTSHVKTTQKFRELLPVPLLEDPWSWAQLLCETSPEIQMHLNYQHFKAA